jgi:hypothetical protein
MAKYKLKAYSREEFEQLAIIVKNLRYHTKYWQLHFGSNNRNNMKRWEEKADQWLCDNLEEKED